VTMPRGPWKSPVLQASFRFTVACVLRAAFQALCCALASFVFSKCFIFLPKRVSPTRVEQIQGGGDCVVHARLSKYNTLPYCCCLHVVVV